MLLVELGGRIELRGIIVHVEGSLATGNGLIRAELVPLPTLAASEDTRVEKHSIVLGVTFVGRPGLQLALGGGGNVADLSISSEALLRTGTGTS